MLPYNQNLKDKSRQLRKNQTDGEKSLWLHLRNKRLLGVQFYRQKPIGEYIVDFYAPRVKMVVEVDGSQHLEGDHVQKDRSCDEYLSSLGLQVLRFNSREVLKEREAVVELILRRINERLNSKIPPLPPFSKGGIIKKDG
jgi:very-short-patch-repair endonuclease